MGFRRSRDLRKMSSEIRQNLLVRRRKPFKTTGKCDQFEELLCRCPNFSKRRRSETIAETHSSNTVSGLFKGESQPKKPKTVSLLFLWWKKVGQPSDNLQIENCTGYWRKRDLLSHTPIGNNRNQGGAKCCCWQQEKAVVQSRSCSWDSKRGTEHRILGQGVATIFYILSP